MANGTNSTSEIPVAFGAWSTLSRNTAIFLLALNILLSITASLGNVVILIALYKVSSIFPPTKLLFRCLAVTDLCVGLISHPVSVFLLVYFSIFKNHENYSFAIFIFHISHSVYFLSSVVFSQISVLTSAAISVDRLLALLLRLRYRQVVTLRRVREFIVFSVLVGILSGALGQAGFILSLDKTAFLFFNVIFYGLIILAMIISICSYTKIFFTIQRKQAQVHGHMNPGQLNGEGNPLNITRYKKTVYTVAWVQLALFICYAPFITMTMRFTNGLGSSAVNSIALHFVTCLVNLNSSLNPILYFWRIRDVRQQVKNILRTCTSCLLS